MSRFENLQANRDYCHFIITLFNVKNFFDETHDNEAWLRWTIDRIEIFKKYCLPSVQNQTNQSFKWLLYFDTSTPREIINAFRDEVKFTNIEVICKNGYDDFHRSYVEDLKIRTPDNIAWIVQSRFDNDDILHKKALHYIQKNIKLQDKFIVSLSSGYTFQLKSGLLSHYYYTMGPFITLVEDRAMAMKGIYFCYHHEWPNLKLKIYKEILHLLHLRAEKVHFVLSPALWIQLIHGWNKHNTADRGFPVMYEKSLTGFSNGLQVSPSKISRIKLHVHYVWWKRYFKAWLVLCMRKLLFYRE